MRQRLLRIDDGVAKLEEAGIFAVLMGLVVVLFLQVVFRFVVERPLDFTEELSRILLIWLVFLGAARGAHAGEHFMVDFVFNALPAVLRKVIGPLVDLVTVAFLAAVIWIGWRSAVAGALQTLPVLGVSVMVQTLAMPVGAALMTLHFLVLPVRRRAAVATAAEAEAEAARC